MIFKLTIIYSTESVVKGEHIWLSNNGSDLALSYPFVNNKISKKKKKITWVRMHEFFCKYNDIIC